MRIFIKFHHQLPRLAHRRARRAFMIIELLITLTIFVTVAILSVQALVGTTRAAKKIQQQVFLYSEAQAALDQLTRDIEQSTVDYEAYYLRNVQGETGWQTDNYGYYGQAFYHPGEDGPYSGPYSGISDYGVYCPGSTTTYYPEDCPTETPDYADLDFDTGAHPFTAIDDFSGYTDDETYMNAFCEGTTGTGSSACISLEYFVDDELILISSSGDLRTVFLREYFNNTDTTDPEYRLSKVVLEGTDSDSDGIVDKWTCSSDYGCDGTGADSQAVPIYTDLTDNDTPPDDFLPITPDSITITEFYVYIAPNEDPYRAFAEEDAQIQPQVTIILTATLSEDYGSGLLGDVPTITLQRTVSTGVYSPIVSYE